MTQTLPKAKEGKDGDSKKPLTSENALSNQVDASDTKSKRLWYIYDKINYPVFEVTIKRDQYWETHCELMVREITAWVEGSDGRWNVPDDFEDYMEIDIKWDGCSHYRVGNFNEDGSRDAYLHLCGASAIKRHCELLKILYNRAFKEMERSPEDEAWVNDLELKDE